MFDNDDSNGDAEDSTEYEVVDTQTGEEFDRYDEYDDAASVVNDLNGDYSFTDPYEVREVESEDNDDTDGYDFFDVPEEDEEEDVEPADRLHGEAKRWTLGSHTTADNDERESIRELLSGVDSEVDADLYETLDQASQLVGTQNVSGFECQVCGLNHSHDDRKHDVRDIFGVTEAFADQMEFNPFCHCGVNELAMLMEFYPYIQQKMFDADFTDAVSDINGRVLADVLDVLWDRAGASGGFDAEEAARKADRLWDLSDDDLTNIEVFYSEVQSIRNAADGAPIPSHVRESIEESREQIEERIAGL
jgi:hypothetical protein